MGIINTTKGVRVYVNGVDMSNFFLTGTVTDSSILASSIITTTGSLSFNGGPNNQYLDFKKSIFPIASTIKIWVELDNGRFALHPRGTLYVIDSSLNLDARTLNIDVGCSLAYIQGRENIYTEQIGKLYAAIPDSIGRNFKVDDLSMTNLSAALDACNRVMFQDAYGNIQTTPSFGYDPSNGAYSSPKMTSFDTHTSLSVISLSETSSQEYVKSITVTANLDVPQLIRDEKDVKQEEDLPAAEPDAAEDEEFTPSQPPPFIQSSTTRSSTITYLGWYSMRIPGGIAYFDDESSDTSQTAASPCYLPPGEEDPTPQKSENAPSKVCRCNIGIKSQIVREQIVSGGVVEYKGKGNQVSYEEQWEYGMEAVFASSYYNAQQARYEQAVNTNVGYSNSALSKYNQHKQALQNFESDDPKYAYHQCNMEEYYKQAEYFRQTANWLYMSGASIGAGEKYGVSTCTQTTNTYNKDGKLIKKVVVNLKHSLTLSASWRGAQPNTFGLSSGYVSSSGRGRENYNYSFSRGSGGRPSGKIGANYSGFSLDIASFSVTEYLENPQFNVTTETYTDFEDSTRSYQKTSYSSLETNAATQEDRLIKEGDKGSTSITAKNNSIAASGELDAEVEEETCRIDSESFEQSVTVYTGFEPPSYTAQSWFGAPNAVSKTVSLPTELMPIAPDYDSFAEKCTLPSIVGRRATLLSIMRNYGITQVKKVIGDQTGFRVVEQMRPELFGYHPGYPVTVSLETLNTAYKCRSSSVTWGFDSNNCICSLDLFALGEISQPVFSSPTINAVQFKTQSSELVITRSLLKIPENAATLKITSLPDSGVLSLSGVPVEIGDEIPVSLIDAGELILVLS